MVIGVVGNIASGKSTITSLLHDQFGWPAHQEAFAENPFLPSFYEAPQRWSLSSQLFFLAEKARQGQKEIQPVTAEFQIWDSPIQHNAWTFAQAQHRLGNATEAEWALYQKLFGLLEPTLPALDAVYWAHTPVDELEARIVSRARSFEQGIPRQYLELLDQLNAEWVSSLKVPVYEILPGDLDLSTDKSRVQSANWLWSFLRPEASEVFEPLDNIDERPLPEAVFSLGIR